MFLSNLRRTGCGVRPRSESPVATHGVRARCAGVSLTVSLAVVAAVLFVPGAATWGQQKAGFVRWTEPKEKAFSVEVPQGWNVSGALIRVGKTDLRSSVYVESPNDDQAILMNDPNIPRLATIGPQDQERGVTEGHTENVGGAFNVLYLNYMPATEFNRWYMQTRIAELVDDLQIRREENLPRTAAQMTAEAKRKPNPIHARIQTSCAITHFAGTEKETGKPIVGRIVTMTQIYVNPNPRYSSLWQAKPYMIACDADNNAEARLEKLSATLRQMQNTFRWEPAWSKKEEKRVAQILRQGQAEHRRQLALIKDANARAQALARYNAAVRVSSGSGYVGSTSVGSGVNSDASHRRFLNYIREEHQVVTSSGQTVTVPD